MADVYGAPPPWSPRTLKQSDFAELYSSPQRSHMRALHQGKSLSPRMQKPPSKLPSLDKRDRAALPDDLRRGSMEVLTASTRLSLSRTRSPHLQVSPAALRSPHSPHSPRAIDRAVLRVDAAGERARWASEAGRVRTVEKLHERMRVLGRTASIEMSPSQVLGHEATLARLPAGTVTFVNMIQPETAHFADVEAACTALRAHRLRAVPHFPCCRFSAAEPAAEVLDRLCGGAADGGAAGLLLVGGHDRRAGAEAGNGYGSVGDALAAGVLMPADECPYGASWRRGGLQTVFLAGHPQDGTASTAALVANAEHLFGAGYGVGVCTQLCGSADRLVRWLDDTRHRLNAQRMRHPGAPPILFHIGVAGPTSPSTLQRIGTTSELSSLAISTAVEAGGTADAAASTADGDAASSGDGDKTASTCPDEAVLAIAEFAERENLTPDELVLHFFPFGGVAKTAELIEQMLGGAWPIFDTPSDVRTDAMRARSLWGADALTGGPRDSSPHVSPRALRPPHHSRAQP